MKKFFVISVSVIVGLVLALISSLVFGNPSVAQTPRVPSTTAAQVNVADVAFINTASEAGLAFTQMGQLA